MSVSKSADPMTKKYKVEIDPKGIDLNPGQFVRVEFTSAKGLDGDRLFIPITAVLISSNETYVWTIEEGRTEKVPVELGNIQGDHVEVIQGIDSGMEIIIKGGRIIEKEETLVEVQN
jgi:multidrug efflux pump subunit AcrA (membrane-fusion protein)